MYLASIADEECDLKQDIIHYLSCRVWDRYVPCELLKPVVKQPKGGFPTSVRLLCLYLGDDRVCIERPHFI